MSEEIKFEKAMERLAKIVEDLESGDIGLEEALKRYEEGVKLSKVCQDQLLKAEKKIEVLTKSLNGTFTKEPFEEAEPNASFSARKPARKSKSESAKSAEDTEKDILL